VLAFVVVLFFPFVMFSALFLVMTVEFAGERNSVCAVIGAYAEADESPVAKPAKAAVAIRGAGSRIFDFPRGRGIVAGPEAVRAAPDPPGTLGVVEAGRPAAQRVARAAGALQVALQPVRMRAEARVAADGVHNASHGIAAVEQRRGPLHHFNSFERQRIESFGVIAGCR